MALSLLRHQVEHHSRLLLLLLLLPHLLHELWIDLHSQHLVLLVHHVVHLIDIAAHLRWRLSLLLHQALRRRWCHGNGLVLERDLKEELLGLGVPVRPEAVVHLVNLATRHLERYGLIGLRSEQQVLPLAIRRLHTLLIGRHESVPRYEVVNDLRVVDLEEQTLMLGDRIALFGHFVTGATDLDELFNVHVAFGALRGRSGAGRLGSFLGRSPRQIGLMLLALRVRQVASLVVVQGQAELTLVSAKMVAHEVGILEDVDRFQSELFEAFASVAVGLGGRGNASHARLAASCERKKRDKNLIRISLESPEFQKIVFQVLRRC